MIKLEHVVLASPEQIAFIIEGMRNPMNSWEKGDSSCGTATRDTNVQWNDDYFIGTNDAYLMQHLANSCSTMHKIQTKEFRLEDFSCEHLSVVSLDYLRNSIEHLNFIRDVYNDDKSNKGSWWQMIQLLPSSYNQTRNVMMNYEVLANIYKSRKDHKLDEWRNFCEWIEELPYSELITGGVE